MILAASLVAIFAQWSDQPQFPNLIAGFPAEQVLPKVGITDAGHVYISRFDNATGGYKVFLQLLSPQGIPEWAAPEGTLVSDHPSMSWLTDYDLTVSQTDNVLITFQDIRNAGVNNVFAYKLNLEGNQLWGPDGVTLTYDTYTDYANMSPIIFSSVDNSTYVAWQRMGPTTTIGVNRLSSEGQKLWGENGIVIEPPAGSCTWPQIIQSDGTNILLKYYIDSGPFWAPNRHIYVAKFTAEGQLLWTTLISNAGGVTAWQQEIAFKPDGAGGAILAWYDDRNNDMINDVYVQRVDVNGTVSMATNGELISTDSSNQQFYPKLAVDTTNQQIYAFYKITNPGQTMDGLGRQLMNYDGTRLWTDAGETMIALSSYVASPVEAYINSYGAACIYEVGSIPSSDTSMHLKASCFLASGASAWQNEVIELASNNTNKYHFSLAQNIDGWVVLAWEEGFSDMDIYAMRLNCNGTLGTQYPAPVNLTAEFIPPNSVLLNWEFPYISYQPTGFYVYMDGELGQSVPPDQFSYLFSQLPPGIHSFYVIASYPDNQFSLPSATVEVMVVSNDDAVVPTPVPWLQVYPNPVKNNATLRFNVIKPAAEGRVEIYNLRGQKVAELSFIPSLGDHTLSLNPDTFKPGGSGIYLIRLRLDEEVRSRKVMILR